MKFTDEQIKKAKMAKNAEELITITKENGITLTEEEAKKYFDYLQKEEELTEDEFLGDELENVSGGCEFYGRPEKVNMAYDANGKAICPSCKSQLGFYAAQLDANKDMYDPAYCKNQSCGRKFRHYWEGNEWTKN